MALAVACRDNSCDADTASTVAAGLVAGFVVCLAYIVGTRYFAPQFHAVFIALSDAAPAAERRFIELDAQVSPLVLVLDDMWDAHLHEISVRGVCLEMIERLAAEVRPVRIHEHKLGVGRLP